MSPDLFSTITVILYVLYVSVNGLWTKEFYRIQGHGRRFAMHVVLCVLLAVVGVGASISFGKEYYFGATYLAMPAVYLFLLVLASVWTRKHHGRVLILATKNNMQSEETRLAQFSDYLLFFVVHIVPIVVPMMLFDV
jgi:hypothetical protein